MLPDSYVSIHVTYEPHSRSARSLTHVLVHPWYDEGIREGDNRVWRYGDVNVEAGNRECVAYLKWRNCLPLRVMRYDLSAIGVIVNSELYRSVACVVFEDCGI